VLLRGLWRRRGLPASKPMLEAKEGLLEVFHFLLLQNRRV
jgi:hypothetical protein